MPRGGGSRMESVLCRPLCWLGFLILLSSSVSLAQTDRQHDPLPSFQPLSRQENFDYYLSSTFSLQDVMERSALAGIAQWRNSPPEWEQGMAGVWAPERQQTMAHALRNAGLSLGTEAGWNVLREFWPEIKRVFRKGE